MNKLPKVLENWTPSVGDRVKENKAPRIWEVKGIVGPLASKLVALEWRNTRKLYPLEDFRANFRPIGTNRKRGEARALGNFLSPKDLAIFLPYGAILRIAQELECSNGFVGNVLAGRRRYDTELGLKIIALAQPMAALNMWNLREQNHFIKLDPLKL